jgi:copper(I)-binding protein
MTRDLILLILAAALIFSCGEKKQDESGNNEKSVMKADQLAVENVWTRVGSENGNSAMYFDIVNNTSFNDTLIKAATDAAELVEIHETYNMDENKMGMRQVKNVPVPAGSTFYFKPMGHHIMLIKLKRDLKAGDTVKAVLKFRKSGELKINSPVKNMNKQN